jgi:hypothetical protein
LSFNQSKHVAHVTINKEVSYLKPVLTSETEIWTLKMRNESKIQEVGNKICKGNRRKQNKTGLRMNKSEKINKAQWRKVKMN